MRFIVFIIFLAILSTVVNATDERVFRWQASAEIHAEAPLGEMLPTARYATTDQPVALPKSLLGQPFVIAVRDPDCPVSRRYAARLRELEANGLSLIFLLTGSLARLENVQLDRARHQLAGTYILDADRRLGNWLGVRTSSEVYLFDAAARLRYRGAIDDQYGVGFSRPEPRQRFLLDALNALQQQKPVLIEATSSPGCFVNVFGNFKPNNAVTWYNQIDSLMRSKCQLCHRPGQAGPFPLQTYQQVAERKTMIRFVLENHIMPPWPTLADHERWMNERILLDEERQLIIDWIDAGAPQGEGQQVKKFSAWQHGWQWGEPDMILSSSRELNIPATGDVPYEYVSLPTDFEQDRWVEAIEVQTQASQNAHHILLFLLPPETNPQKYIPGIGMKTSLNRREMHELTLRGFFGGYVAGLPGVRYQPNSAKRLPKGWRILMQIHYEPNGQRTTDRPRVGLYFAAHDPEKVIETRAAATIDLHIPPGAVRHEESGEYYFHNNGEIVGFFAHTHLRGTAFRYVLQQANGEQITLLDIPKYDPNWQFYYQLRKPIQIEAGSKLVATGWYDNSRANPNNPDPNADVRFGLRTRDEMMIGYFDWVVKE